jgi:hypothetical protein
MRFEVRASGLHLLKGRVGCWCGRKAIILERAAGTVASGPEPSQSHCAYPTSPFVGSAAPIRGELVNNDSATLYDAIGGLQEEVSLV